MADGKTACYFMEKNKEKNQESRKGERGFTNFNFACNL